MASVTVSERAGTRRRAVLDLSSTLKDVVQTDGEFVAQLEDIQGELDTSLESVSFACHPSALSDGRARLANAQESLRDLDAAFQMAKQLQSLLHTECQAARAKVNTLALRVGFSSLPDEILSDILVLATRPLSSSQDAGEEPNSVVEMGAILEARTLSHVCQRFRSLLLNSPRVWNIVSEHMIDTSKIRTCIERSRQAPMDILLENFGLRQRQTSHFSIFFKFCLLSASHWRSLRIGRFIYPKRDYFVPENHWNIVRENLLSIGRLSGRLALPNLKRLIICFNHLTSTEHWLPKFHPYWQWSMPSLVDLRLTACQPPPADVSFGASLQKFSFQFNPNDVQMFGLVQLAEFLSSCQVLEKVALSFVNWISALPCAPHGIAPVQEVAFTFHYCRPDAGIAICNSFHFPNASKVYLKWESDLTSSMGRDTFIQELLLRHPLVKLFHLEYGVNDQTLTTMVPPISTFVLPALEKLVLSFFKPWGELGFSYRERVCPLRILELHMCDVQSGWNTLRDWAEQFFSQLKEQGDLDTFERFYVYEEEYHSDGADYDLSKIENEIHKYLPSEKLFIGVKC